MHVEGISRLIVSFVVATVVRGDSWLFRHRSSDLQNLPPGATSSLPSACYFLNCRLSTFVLQFDQEAQCTVSASVKHLLYDHGPVSSPHASD